MCARTAIERESQTHEERKTDRESDKDGFKLRVIYYILYQI